MIYRYSGLDKNGKKVKDKIEASNIDEAKAKLKSNDIYYTKISPENLSFFSNTNLKRKYNISPKELSSLSRELATYIKSGISIVQAIKIAKNHYQNNKKIAIFLNEVFTLLDEGENFYSALSKQNTARLPEFYLESIKVSEDGGILDEVLLELSAYLKEQDRIKKEIKSAFAYPSFMIVVSFFMIAFMLTFVVPQITSIFASMHQELPTPTKIVVTLGEFFKNNWTKIITGLGIFIVLFLVFKKKSKRFSYIVDGIILRLPFFGKLVQKTELARFSYMASLLTKSGVTFVQTVNLSANILNNLVLKKIFLDASKMVVEGKTLSSSLLNYKKNIDFAFIQSIALAEETSEVENVLKNISELYFEENKDKISILLSLLEPALMLLVGGSIGFIVAAMLLPIFSMSIQ